MDNLTAKKINDGELQIKELEKKRVDFELAIGKKYVEEHIDDAKFEEEYAEELEGIKSLMQEQAKIEETTLALKGQRKCTCCNSIIVLNSKFCNQCGAKLEEIQLPEIEVGPICPTCGTVCDPNINFCTECGTKLK